MCFIQVSILQIKAAILGINGVQFSLLLFSVKSKRGIILPHVSSHTPVSTCFITNTPGRLNYFIVGSIGTPHTCLLTIYHSFNYLPRQSFTAINLYNILIGSHSLELCLSTYQISNGYKCLALYNYFVL